MNRYLIISFLFLFFASCKSNSTATKINEENLSREKFGMEVANLSDEHKTQTGLSHGVEIISVYSYYPASKAGLDKGDIVVSLNDQNVFDLAGFKAILNKYKYAYGQVTFGIYRGKQIQKIKVHLN